MEKNFDIRDFTEFERIAVTLNLQQMNKINPEIKFVCSKCGKENSYRLDTAKLLREFAKSYKEDQKFDLDAGTRKFVIEAGWPKVSSVEDFFKHYYKKYMQGSKFRQYIYFIASYTTNPPILENNDDYNIWQFSCKGSIRGIRGDVDLSCLMGKHTLREIMF